MLLRSLSLKPSMTICTCQLHPELYVYMQLPHELNTLADAAQAAQNNHEQRLDGTDIKIEDNDNKVSHGYVCMYVLYMLDVCVHILYACRYEHVNMP